MISWASVRAVANKGIHRAPQCQKHGSTRLARVQTTGQSRTSSRSLLSQARIGSFRNSSPVNGWSSWAPFAGVAILAGLSSWYSKEEDSSSSWLSAARAEESRHPEAASPKLQGKDSSDQAPMSADEEQQMKEGIERMKKAAEAGNPEAQYDYAVMLYRNASSNSPTDPKSKREQQKELEKAIELFEKAASGGVKEAMYNVGVLYVTGHRLADKRVTKGVEWIQRAAEAGCAPAALRLGHMHLQGAEGTSYSPSVALYYFELASELGLSEAQYMSGVLYGNGTITPSTPNRAYALSSTSSISSHTIPTNSNTPTSKSLSGSGNLETNSGATDSGTSSPSPSSSLGSSPHEDYRTMTKESLSLKRFIQAAEQGHAAAACNAAMMFHNGIGTESDMKQAFHWYREAADGGDSDAAALLSLFHLYGYPSVVTQNVPLGLELLQLAANLESPLAQRTLASLLLARGEMSMQHLVTPLLPPNARNAYELLVRCARADDNDCRSELANMIIKGETEMDEKHANLSLAYRLIAKAAQEGHPRAMTKKALMQQLGIGTPENKIQAAMALLKATQVSKSSEPSLTPNENGTTYTPSAASIQSAVPAANFFLGMAYILGDGVDKSYTKGMAHLTTASGLGFEPATRAIHYVKKDVPVDFLEKEKQAFLASPELPFKLGATQI